MDMNSTNGTWLNGMRLKQGEIIEIEKNDEILIGKVRVIVVYSE
jgi:pSer/pThr/pTyr-binding forkhead associated (FHA) protein